MPQPQNYSFKTEMKEALKSKFFYLSVFTFWALTGIVFFYGQSGVKNLKTVKSIQMQNSVEMSSEAPAK